MSNGRRNALITTMTYYSQETRGKPHSLPCCWAVEAYGKVWRHAGSKEVLQMIADR